MSTKRNHYQNQRPVGLRQDPYASSTALTPVSQAGSVDALIRELEYYGRILVRGVHAVELVRQTLAHVIQNAGVKVYFDPSTPPAVQDYLLGGAVCAVEGAAVGGLIGLFIGALVGNPVLGLKIGAGVGATTGGAYGVSQVQRGWHVQISADSHGMPQLLLERK